VHDAGAIGADSSLPALTRGIAPPRSGGDVPPGDLGIRPRARAPRPSWPPLGIMSGGCDQQVEGSIWAAGRAPSTRSSSNQARSGTGRRWLSATFSPRGDHGMRICAGRLPFGRATVVPQVAGRCTSDPMPRRPRGPRSFIEFGRCRFVLTSLQNARAVHRPAVFELFRAGR